MSARAAALAVGASFLLSLNQSDFPHGATHRSVVFWHPDTFLTAYFQSDQDAYVYVRDELTLLSDVLGARLLP